MTRITKAEIVKLAQLSQLEINDAEAEKLVSDIASVLTYILRIKEVAHRFTLEDELPRQANILRSDEVVPTNPRPILAQAPLIEDSYFVVPVILKAPGAKL